MHDDGQNQEAFSSLKELISKEEQIFDDKQSLSFNFSLIQDGGEI